MKRPWPWRERLWAWLREGRGVSVPPCLPDYQAREIYPFKDQLARALPARSVQRIRMLWQKIRDDPKPLSGAACQSQRCRSQHAASR